MENQVKNCAVGVDGSSCEFCMKGFILNEIGKCALIKAPFCSDKTNDTNSLSQSISFEYSNSSSAGLFQHPFLLSPFGPGCNSCDEGYVSVLTEDKDYVCSENSFLAETADFDNDFYRNNCEIYARDKFGNLICQICLNENTEFIQTITNKCATKSDYADCKIAQDNEFCSECEDTFFLEGGTCGTGSLEHCLKYQSKTSCSKCSNGYYLSNGSCL